MTDRPNLLLITSDQQRGDCFGFEGRPVRTPHLDEMASAGTRFSTCITPNVVCQPARASILTGLLPRTHGVSDNGIDLADAAAERGFAARLTEHGYRTGLLGKAHFTTHNTFKPTGTPECLLGRRCWRTDSATTRRWYQGSRRYATTCRSSAQAMLSVTCCTSCWWIPPAGWGEPISCASI